MPTEISGDTGVNQIQSSATSASLPVFQCRAWVNFDGTKDTGGAVSTALTNRLIRGSGNVASVLRNGTGDYTITFTTAMSDANYAAIIAGNGTSSVNVTIGGTRTALAGSCRIDVGSGGTGSAVPQDRDIVSVAIYR